MKNKYKASHKPLLNRINRISGQLSGIALMIEEERYCMDILNQIKASRSALKSLELQVMEGHLKCCLTGAAKSGSKEEIEIKIQEIIKLIKSTSKC